MNQPEQFLKVQNRLGETPIWDPEENLLYWVDWGGRPSCSLAPDTKEFKTFPVEDLPVTAIARRASGGWIAIAQQGIYAWDPKTNAYEQLVGLAEADSPDNCYNDAAVDRQGRLLVGTVNMADPFAPDGGLYRLDPDLSLHKLDGGYATANGIGVSPDGKTVYVTDMRNHQIIVLDYDPEKGTTSNRRVFARVPESAGMPDGLIVDAEGYVWSGHWAGWVLTRYNPNGKIERQVRFPVEHVISFTFGGPDLGDLFITTSQWDFGEKELEEQPFAGDLFYLKTDIKGLVEPAFAG